MGNGVKMKEQDKVQELTEEIEAIEADAPEMTAEEQALHEQAASLSRAYIQNLKGAAVNCLLMSGIRSSDSQFAQEEKMQDAIKAYVHDLKLFIKSNFGRLVGSVRDAENAAIAEEHTQEEPNAEDSSSVSEADAHPDDIPQE